MSKIIKDSAGFIPETIVTVEAEKAAVWDNLAKPLAVEEDVSEDRRPLPELEEREEEQDADAPADFDFDSDFSSPEIEQQAPAPAIPERREQQVEIDIKALADEHYNRGVQAGIARMESDYGSTVKTLQSACEQLHAVHETILRNSLEEMQNMVLRIAEKILRVSLASQQETVVRTVEEAIQQAVRSDEFVIKVNPADYATIKAHSSDFIHAINGLENIIIKSDKAVAPGGCIVESDTCTVDATISSQMDIIAEAIRK